MVVNIESTVQAIQRAVEEAELMADCTIHEVFTGIAGSHIKSVNSHGMVAIREREVTQADIDRVIETARAAVMILLFSTIIFAAVAPAATPVVTDVIAVGSVITPEAFGPKKIPNVVFSEILINWIFWIANTHVHFFLIGKRPIKNGSS